MSTEIQRYGPVEKSECGRFWEDIDPMPDGHYVLFSDHQKALADQQAKTEVELARGQQWCADFIAMRKERDQLQSALASEYGRGVTAGKLEAGKYTPEEREAYGKHVAHADEWTGLKNRLAEVAAERDRLLDQSEINELRAQRDAALCELKRIKKRAQDFAIVMSL